MTFIPNRQKRICIVACDQKMISSGRCACINNSQLNLSDEQIELFKDLLEEE